MVKYLYVFFIISISYFQTGNLIAQNLLNNPESVVFDSARNRYLVSNWGNGTIVQMDSAGNQSYFNADYLNQFRIAALHIYNDTLLAAAGDGSGAGVLGFDLATGQMVFHDTLLSVGLPNDIVTDSSGITYVTDYWGSKLYKIENHISTILIDTGLPNPNGMLMDYENNRLLILSVVPNSKILSVDLSDTSISIVYTTTFSGMDGITVDNDGIIYVSEWTGDAVHKFSDGFSGPPQVFSTGHTDPADIYFDKVNNLLAIPNFSSNSVDFVDLPASSIKKEKQHLPQQIILNQNYPNPFNPSTTIEYYLEKASHIKIEIYDLLGKKIKTILGDYKTAGNHQVVFNAKDIASGIYLYKMETPQSTQVKKMILLR